MGFKTGTDFGEDLFPGIRFFDAEIDAVFDEYLDQAF